MTPAPSPDVAPPPPRFDVSCETLIVGAGACGMVAALAAKAAGQDVLVIEADPAPGGSTALSAGLIPAAGTALQRAAGIADSPATFAADIQHKAKGENDPRLVDTLTRHAATVIDWLTETHGLPFSLVTDFDYPGHSHRRMHGLPSRSGAALIDALRQACEAAGIDIACNRRAHRLFHDTRLRGLALATPDGSTETIGCEKLVLACNGFGGNRTLVAELTPDIRDALWFGHDGNKGEAILWGRALGAGLHHLGAYQGHGNVAQPHGILITWATITEGGFQVNRDGRRFWNEAQGYSEAARAVLAQPGGTAWAIFDSRIAAIARQFEDFKTAERSGAIVSADSIEDLATRLGLPPVTLAETLDGITPSQPDRFGRRFTQTLTPPYCGTRVTGALFHTQGGLVTDPDARVLDTSGTPIPGLFAGGGAACGVSGSGDAGYLSGNGLLSATVMGWLAGRADPS